MVEYHIEYQYRNKRGYLGGREITKYTLESARAELIKLLDKMKAGDSNAPISIPHITKLVDGDAKLVDIKSEFNIE